MKNQYIAFILLFLLPFAVLAKEIEVKGSVNEAVVLDGTKDLHLTGTSPFGGNGSVNIISEDAWLFFDNLLPSELSSLYNKITIAGEALQPEANARIGIYKHGSVVIPHGSSFQPLETYTEQNFSGNRSTYSTNRYYSNNPAMYEPTVPDDSNADNKKKWDNYRAYQSLLNPLTYDNAIRSFKLKRGYMATLANESDGLGYSRVFIADKEDLLISELPDLLDRKVSFIRVMKWESVSKKGWVGSIDKDQPEGLKYVREQSDKTKSTWFYNWSPTTTWTDKPNTAPGYNQEFVPQKWSTGGDLNEMLTAINTANLLGYNEPDDSNQANKTVEEALEDWPKLMQTGLRLGSPAIAKSNDPRTWLYRFMDECNKRNYRVDFIAIHCYWGGKDPKSWYEELKAIYEKTKRPLWITEWNNGANWTKEPWPGDDAAQKEKQLKELTAILEVLDTCRFIERYSIYNWVENKRAIIEFGSNNSNRGKLTPAGEYYAANLSDIAYRSELDYIPVWTIREAPVLSLSFNPENKKNTLSWTDYNKELISGFIIEQSLDGVNFTEIQSVEYNVNTYEVSLPDVSQIEGGNIYYRVKSVAYDNQTGKISNIVKANIIDNKTDDITFFNIKVKEEPETFIWKNEYDAQPVTITGTLTFRNQLPLTSRMSNLSKSAFETRLNVWEYLENPAFRNPDTLAIMSFPAAGNYDLGGIKLKARVIEDATSQWQTISFDTPFEEVPVVIASQASSNNHSATSVRVKNITENGFQIKLQYEEALAPPDVKEVIHYIAATVGTGIYKDNKIQVGRSSEAVVGDYYNPAQIELDGNFSNPAFLGFMQTESDGIASTLRIKQRNLDSVTLFKEREKSKSSTVVTKEAVGWFIIETRQAISSISNSVLQEKMILYDPSDGCVKLSDGGLMNTVNLYSIVGRQIKSERSIYDLDVNELKAGIYIVKVADLRAAKFFKD